jgi:hypothetical protein
METQKESRHDEQVGLDFGTALIGGVIICLAVYGGYKLFQKESNRTPLLGSGVDSEIIQQIVDRELKS